MEEAKILSKPEEEKEEVVEVKKENLKYSLAETATGYATVIAFDGKAITEQQALVELLNKVDRIEKNLLG